MTKSEMMNKGLIPFTTMFRNIMGISNNTLIYNDIRKGKVSKRRLKIQCLKYKPNTKKLILLEQELKKYNYSIFKHNIFSKSQNGVVFEYVFYFKEYKSIKLKTKDFYHNR